MIFRQMFDSETWTYTYLIADPVSGEAALIDSVHEQSARDAKVLKELGLKLKYLLETHVHADHITGVSDLKTVFPAAQSVVSAQGGAPCADHQAKDGDSFKLGALEIQVLTTPGHTNGCLSYRVQDLVFTGDALLIRGCGRTDFQEGDAGQLFDSVTQKLFSLPAETRVYPAHNYAGLTMSTIGEEKQFNPRFAHKSRAEFITLMNNLNLPQPAKIMESVPANLKCGNLAELSVNQTDKGKQ
jgi:sulfur dioxygenase